MRPRIAIPMPHSLDREYAERSIPQYERAVEMAGGEAVRVSLGEPEGETNKIIQSCDGVLLPGSKADVDPAKFNATRSPHTAGADMLREATDEVLLREAYKVRMPVLGICYGLQSLNVFRGGSLIQHIPDFLPEELRARVNHEAGKTVAVAHTVEIEKDSKLAAMTGADAAFRGNANHAAIGVNSSHHQSAESIGQGLRIVARCTEDGIIEAVEGTDADHFVLAVQWHPERSVEDDEASRAIFRALIEAAKRRG
jgi:putative glutamine amidotransferase